MTVQQPRKRTREVYEVFVDSNMHFWRSESVTNLSQRPAIIFSMSNSQFKEGDRVRVTVTKVRANRHD